MIDLKGSFAAIITPFKDDKIDEDALRKIVNFQLESGTSGIVPCGSTGESSLLTLEEYLRVIEIVVEEVKGKLPVLCGTGTNSTSASVNMIKRAAKLGVDGFLTIVPYYNKPTQEGMMAHFGALAESAEQSIVLYNIPGIFNDRKVFKHFSRSLTDSCIKYPVSVFPKICTWSLFKYLEYPDNARPGF